MRRRPLPILAALDARVAARTEATRAEHPWWPCAAGCDDCCRSLPSLPTITEPEWLRLADAIAALGPEVATALRARIAAGSGPAPVTCPLLDPAAGTCLVYAARPIACRTYGFYAERDAGLHCDKVTRAVALHEDAEIVWGNGEAIAEDLRPLGPLRPLDEWLRGQAIRASSSAATA